MSIDHAISLHLPDGGFKHAFAIAPFLIMALLYVCLKQEEKLARMAGSNPLASPSKSQGSNADRWPFCCLFLSSLPLVYLSTFLEDSVNKG